MMNEKTTLRAHLRALRDSLDGEYIAAASRSACERIAQLDEFGSATAILLYFPINNEISPLFLLDVAQKWGKKIAFPVCDHESGKLIFREISNLNELKKAKFGLFEPNNTCPILIPDEKTLCIVPAIAFDENGDRLGYGKGFYDRFLRDFKGTSVGLVHSELLVPYLPRDEHDTLLCTIATEKGIFKIQ
ncbi:MAG: 5-formyltetrahydrofolate cyclo-ligase [Clostridia bacterium]|nr:5-formyltetrahydrofolate cyclo-ligase [Clostridia bacterium]